MAVCVHFLSFIGCSQEEAAQRGVYSPQDRYTFPATHVGTSSTLKVNIRNNSADMHEVRPAVTSWWRHGAGRPWSLTIAREDKCGASL